MSWLYFFFDFFLFYSSGYSLRYDETRTVTGVLNNHQSRGFFQYLIRVTETIVLTLTGVINYSISEFTGARTRRKQVLGNFLR